MKAVAISVGSVLLLASVAMGAPTTFSGEIMDNFCATAGSHKSMWTGKGDPNSPEARKQCTLKCVAMGGKFALYNRATKTTYQLDDQQKPRPFAGEAVQVTGTYDAKTHTIHVDRIVPAS
jgi:Protein of unknown function (DUF5818)